MNYWHTASEWGFTHQDSRAHPSRTVRPHSSPWCFSSLVVAPRAMTHDRRVPLPLDRDVLPSLQGPEAVSPRPPCQGLSQKHSVSLSSRSGDSDLCLCLAGALSTLQRNSFF